ncbi:hypothetical protein GCM10027291_52490 [Telluribacter humicola]
MVPVPVVGAGATCENTLDKDVEIIRKEINTILLISISFLVFIENDLYLEVVW